MSLIMSSANKSTETTIRDKAEIQHEPSAACLLLTIISFGFNLSLYYSAFQEENYWDCGRAGCRELNTAIFAAGLFP